MPLGRFSINEAVAKNIKKISVVLYDLGGGGAEQLHINLVNYWEQRGFIVELILLRKEEALLPLVGQDVVMTGLQVDWIRSGILPLAVNLQKSRPYVTLAETWKLTSASIIAWLFAGKTGSTYDLNHTRPSVTRVHVLWVSLFFLISLMRLRYRFASSVIAISQGIKDVLCQLGNFDGRRVKVIHKPATTGATQHRKLLTVSYKLWACGFKRHIMSLGTLKVQKDHQTLIKAFERLPSELDAKLVVLSEGPLRVQLNQLIEQLGLRESVLFPGFIVDPAAWYISVDLFAYSSRWNGLPLVLIETLAFGLPVVSSDCQSGSAEILENGR